MGPQNFNLIKKQPFDVSIKNCLFLISLIRKQDLLFTDSPF